jgi:hypothetical protein
MELWELVARESVRDCIARYNAHGDAGRMEEMLDVFADDGEIDMDGDGFSGREDMRAGFLDAGRAFASYARAAGLKRGEPVLRHLTATTLITVESPERARSSSYFFVLMKHGLDHWGSYHDEFRTVDGSWRLARRRVVVEGRVPGGFAEQRVSPSA